MNDSKPKILKWRGKKVYRCRLCEFDSLDKAKFEDHFAKKHPPVHLRVIEGGKQPEPEPTVEPDNSNEEGN